LDAVTQRYRGFILDIFKRLGLKEELFSFSKVDLARGELIIAEPDKPQKVKATGKEKSAD